jgi:3-phenylpropionate/trans-cinnamate dioxygenase ferredoxin reductase subunit
MSLHRVVIVGASAAGLTAAETLRREGFQDEITLIGEERHLPYDRPPLSKQVLAGDWAAERVSLRKEADYEGFDLRLGTRATGVDTDSQEVLLDSERVGYSQLIIATGVRPRRLPALQDSLEGVHIIRTLDEALALRDALTTESARVVVIGAGFLGCEVAATARKLGRHVTLVDPLEQPMTRQFGGWIGSMVASLHRSQGVEVMLGIGVSALVGSSAVTGVQLSDGSEIPADIVLIAVGSQPATDWLAGSGVPLGDGVLCDEFCRAAPSVYAAGDVANWHHLGYGRRLRIEHRMNATEQGMAVARNVLGADAPFQPVSYFWTDQYDTKIAAFGLLSADAEVTVSQGDPAEGKFVAHYRHDGELIGILGWNMPRELRQERKQLL